MNDKKKIMSPCNSKCVLDPNSKLCRGCFRTIDEIMKWPLLLDEDKLLILAKTEERRANYLR